MVNGSSPIAAIDLGSNSFRLLIGQVATIAGRPLTLLRLRAPVSLVRSMNEAGELAPEAMAEGLASLGEFRLVMSEFAVSRCRCCATAALRQAANRTAFLEAAASMLETEVEVLSPAKEAGLSCQGVRAGLPEISVIPCIIIDLGGGSTELTYLDKGRLSATTSLPFGAVTFSARGRTEKTKLCNQLRDALGKIAPQGMPGPVPTLVATGGTASILAALSQGLAHYAPEKIQGFRLDGAEIPTLAARLSRSAGSGRSLPDMARGREEILLAGLEIYQEIIATIGVEGMIISDAGLLEGILLSLLETA